MSSKVESGIYGAPAIADRIVEFLNNGGVAPTVVIENNDTLSSAEIRFQESDNGSSWTDISDTVATVFPGKSVTKTVISSRARLALYAGGNVKLLVTVIRTVDGSPANLGAA